MKVNTRKATQEERPVPNVNQETHVLIQGTAT